MKRLGYLTLTVLVTALVVVFVLPTTIFATSPITLDNSIPGEYNADEWGFVINQINNHDDMPIFITVTWSDGSVSDVDLDASTSGHKTAHYRDYSHLGLMPVSATADIDSSKCGNFVISHGPGNAVIIVIKNTDAGQATFNFNTTGGQGLPSSFSIITSAGAPFTGSQTYPVFVNSPGSLFGVTEDLTGLGDWTLDSSSASSGGSPGSFLVAPGDAVTVTFNNKFKSTQVLPEFSAGALLGLGLLGIGGFVLIKRQKWSVKAK